MPLGVVQNKNTALRVLVHAYMYMLTSPQAPGFMYHDWQMSSEGMDVSGG